MNSWSSGEISAKQTPDAVKKSLFALRHFWCILAQKKVNASDTDSQDI